MTAKTLEEQPLHDSKMESFTNENNDAQDMDTWEDPYTCCGCIPIKYGMYIMTVGSYIGLIIAIA